jgi:hypothetical protein
VRLQRTKHTLWAADVTAQDDSAGLFVETLDAVLPLQERLVLLLLWVDGECQEVRSPFFPRSSLSRTRSTVRREQSTS